MKPLILGLGNELHGDDGIGLVAARELAHDVRGMADVVESELHGLALIDILIGYDMALIIDAIRTGHHPPGTVMVLDPFNLRPVACPSPHYTGLPEMIQLARELGVKFPVTIKILAIEIKNPDVLTDRISYPVANAVRRIKRLAKEILIRWEQETSCRVENMPGGFSADTTAQVARSLERRGRVK